MEVGYLDITILSKDNKLTAISFNGYQIVHANEVVKTISRNILYHLKSEHPIYS